MDSENRILLIGTNGIDCYFGISQAFDKKGARVIHAHSAEMAKTYLIETQFDAILINLEPDGKGGIEGIDLLPSVIASEINQDAICFSISAASATTLLTAKTKHLNMLSIVVGWLTLPVDHAHASEIISKIIADPSNLSIKNRLPKEK